jgi:ankyrin repeat protein
VKLLIAKGAKFELNHETVVAPLMAAAVIGHTDIAMLHLESGASIDKTGNEGRTALHAAACTSAPDIVRLLCERGAYPDIVDDDGIAALHFVAEQNGPTDGHLRVVSTLCECDASVDAKTPDGFTALHLAVMKGLYDIACLLCERGAMTEMQSNGTCRVAMMTGIFSACLLMWVPTLMPAAI